MKKKKKKGQNAAGASLSCFAPLLPSASPSCHLEAGDGGNSKGEASWRCVTRKGNKRLGSTDKTESQMHVEIIN